MEKINYRYSTKIENPRIACEFESVSELPRKIATGLDFGHRLSPDIIPNDPGLHERGARE